MLQDEIDFTFPSNVIGIREPGNQDLNQQERNHDRHDHECRVHENPPEHRSSKHYRKYKRTVSAVANAIAPTPPPIAAALRPGVIGKRGPLEARKKNTSNKRIESHSTRFSSFGQLRRVELLGVSARRTVSQMHQMPTAT